MAASGQQGSARDAGAHEAGARDAGAHEAGARDAGGRGDSARAALTPLAEGERPVTLLVAVGVCVLLAAGVIAGVLSDHELARHGGSVPGGVFLAGVLLALAANMLRRRYWAVLGFEALLAFQILVTSLALVVANSLLAAGICLVSIALGGTLFWKLIRVMGRIQAGGHANEDASHANEDASHPVTAPDPPGEHA